MQLAVKVMIRTEGLVLVRPGIHNGELNRARGVSETAIQQVYQLPLNHVTLYWKEEGRKKDCM